MEADGSRWEQTREKMGEDRTRRKDRWEQRRADGSRRESRREQMRANVTWKVRRSLLGLSLMLSIGVALIITSVITAHATHAQLHRTQYTHSYSQCMHIISKVSARSERSDRSAFEKDAEFILQVSYYKTNSKQSLASSAFVSYRTGVCTVIAFGAQQHTGSPMVKRPKTQLHSSPQWKPPNHQLFCISTLTLSMQSVLGSRNPLSNQRQ